MESEIVFLGRIAFSKHKTKFSFSKFFLSRKISFFKESYFPSRKVSLIYKTFSLSENLKKNYFSWNRIFQTKKLNLVTVIWEHLVFQGNEFYKQKKFSSCNFCVLGKFGKINLSKNRIFQAKNKSGFSNKLFRSRKIFGV